MLIFQQFSQAESKQYQAMPSPPPESKKQKPPHKNIPISPIRVPSHKDIPTSPMLVPSRSLSGPDQFTKAPPSPPKTPPRLAGGQKSGIGAEWPYRYGKPLNRKDAALKEALREGHAEDIPHLLRMGANVNYQDPIGNTPLIEAVLLDDLMAIGVLLDHGARTDMEDAFGEGPLFKAALQRNDAAMAMLLGHDEPINVDQGPGNGETPLKMLASYGDDWLDMTEKLLERGADANKSDLMGFSPLILSVRNNAPKTVRLLHFYGADPNAKDVSGQSVLMHAIQAGHQDVVSTLLMLEADPNYQNPKGGKTVIQEAIMAGKPEVLRLLLQHKAVVQPEDIRLAERLENPVISRMLSQPNHKRRLDQFSY